MIRKDIYLPRYGWHVILFADFSCEDTDIVLRELENIDCEDLYLRKAMVNMYQCEKNTGLTYTAAPYRTSVAVVYQTSSKKEFVNTISHEIAHICAHITRSFPIKITEEEFCEMIGDCTAEATDVIVNLLC